MKHLCIGLAALSLSAGTAVAGGIERSPQSVGLLFEPGKALQLGFGSVSPDLSGSGTYFGGLRRSGDMAPSYTSLSLGAKMDINDRVDIAVIYDQSLGADVDYGGATVGYPLRGTVAELDGSDVTALIRYRLGERVSVYGGLRVQKIDATLTGLPLGATIPPNLYGLTVGRTQEYGYVIGAAYEIPEIALRVAATYNSAIDHDFEATESVNGVVVGTSPFTTTIPQSVNLEFQSGIAENTLLFGSIRWQDWSEFDITPVAYAGLTSGRSLIDYQSDYTTYTIGIGRRFNETWSGAVTLAHEPSTGDIQGNLAPRDGFTSVGVAATYRHEKTEITAGVRYIKLGDATTQVVNARFEDNDALAFGLRLTQRF